MLIVPICLITLLMSTCTSCAFNTCNAFCTILILITNIDRSDRTFKAKKRTASDYLGQFPAAGISAATPLFNFNSSLYTGLLHINAL